MSIEQYPHEITISWKDSEPTFNEETGDWDVTF